MKTLIAVLAAVLALAFLDIGLGAHQAQAAQNYCKYRYNLCLARCPGTVRRCFNLCQSRYRHCTYKMPYLGDLI
jgi:hypothetical protein